MYSLAFAQNISNIRVLGPRMCMGSSGW